MAAAATITRGIGIMGGIMDIPIQEFHFGLVGRGLVFTAGPTEPTTVIEVRDTTPRRFTARLVERMEGIMVDLAGAAVASTSVGDIASFFHHPSFFRHP
jgi:hypothetical protein